ncbi:SprT-like domain-containing protein [Halobacterium jilantaiense]|uniref:Predicted Zn-dependent metalloprotease, SprT family n=1 Tax=Halobacterium jilantaiense TaxID=355548 RepID=A0A1I0QNK3_9EURY|nr:SprT-like domain-containing protein [Halobacterium jilantaiense]SEW28846.1 Predicted Zn-dependent metalloprotease, SprT family [Halobacterium jilantaiense]
MTVDDPGLDTAFYAIDTDASPEEFLAVARVYAREVVENYDLSVTVDDLDWTVSKRARRRAGAVRHRDGDPETVSLTWKVFTNRGWGAAAETVRHELVHVHLLNEHGDPSHGDRFEAWAERLQTAVTCELFAEPNYWVVCRDCGSRMARYRKSKLVQNPGDYRCGGCGGRLDAREAND